MTEETSRKDKFFNNQKHFLYFEDSVSKLSSRLNFWVHLLDPQIIWKNHDVGLFKIHCAFEILDLVIFEIYFSLKIFLGREIFCSLF